MSHTLAQRAYLDCLCARGYEEQEPEFISARWYHLLWFLVPVIGFLLFVEAVRHAGRRAAR